MKLHSYQLYPVHAVSELGFSGTHVVLRLRTEDGLEGISHVSRLNQRTLQPLIALLSNMLDELRDDDLSDVEGIYHRLYRLDYLPGAPAGLEARAASAIDVALWDLRGKAAGQPVFRLMGATRDRLPVSANWGVEAGGTPDDLAARAQRLMDLGFRGFKFRIGDLSLQETVHHVRTLRESVGPEVRLCADANQRWSVKHAIVACRALEPYDLTWIEDPVPHYDEAALREVKAATTIPICAGEAHQSLARLHGLIQARACDVAMVDMDLGLSGFQRIGSVAELTGTPVVNHLACEQLAHATIAAPTGYIVGFNPWAQPLFTEPVRIEDGCLVLPDRPGLGLELDEDALRRFALK